MRGFAFGLNSVALGLFLAASGLPQAQIGLVLSAALAGTLVLTLVIALRGDRIGRRRLLLAGSALMLLAALIPALQGNGLLLAAVALSGMVAVTSQESTGLQSVDQAILPQTAPPGRRTAVFAAYNLVAAAASALGSLSLGLFVLLGERIGLAGPAAYAPAFWGYALAGLVGVTLAARLDGSVEAAAQAPEGRFGIGRSRGVVARLSALFAVDALAGGFVIQSFLAYWFAARFGAGPGAVGALFFGGGLLTAASFPAAAWLAGRIGLIRTMVFTHIPSNLCLVGMAAVPTLAPAALLYLVRGALSSMDVPTRQSYAMGVVDPAERTATAAVTSLARSSGQVLGPALAGLLLVPAGLGVPLIAGGLLKTAYDLTLFALFRGRPAPEER